MHPCLHHLDVGAVRDEQGRIDADAPKVLWALDFQFDSTVDGKAVKIASMIDEHARESPLHLVAR
ncbi:hypothetical protein [Nocardia sp. NPDC051463]|uniref:hypothetical protein n=1 Tax=Nocardia sp. NPDC051463 TaxID=3154845 RepID=UPI00344CCA77